MPVREVRLSAGAGFVVVICGEIMTMPGLPRVPAAETIRLNDGPDRRAVLKADRAVGRGIEAPPQRAGPSAPVCVFWTTKMKGQGMAATIIDGKAFAADGAGPVAEQVAALKASTGSCPGLAVVLVGEDPASQVYVAHKHKQTVEVGMASFEHKLPADTSEADLFALIDRLNADPAVHGILCQFPVPDHLDDAGLVARIAPEKDVDGLSVTNAGFWRPGQGAGAVARRWGV
jgi:hypothetical protein